MDRAARAVGRALRLPARRSRDARARARALGAGEAARARLRAGDPAGARARAGAVRDRLPARHRAADLLAARGRAVPRRAPPRSRSPRCTRGDPRRRARCRCATPGFSPCFRREAGAAGKDTRGIFRVHQFDKVEMFSFVSPADSGAEHERILAIEEEILGELELPYRVVNIAVGDLGNSAAKKYDCEAWLPSQGRYRELTSCSNTTDYQARRLSIRVRAERGTRRRTRSTAPPSPSGARWWRCWRTASRPTRACSCPSAWSPTARPRGWPRPADLAPPSGRRSASVG